MISESLNPANYSFNWYAVPVFLTALLTLTLGFIVLLGERHSRVSGLFFVMTAAAALWLFSYSLMYCSKVERIASLWAIIGQLGVMLIPPSVYHFTMSTLQALQKHRVRVLLAWLTATAFYLTVLWGDWFLSGVYHYYWGYYAKYGWLPIPFLGFFFLLMALSLRHYWRAYHQAPANNSRLRSKALFVAFSVAYLGSVDYLPAFGVPVYPFGYLPVLGFVVLTARAIWRYRLVDITPAFAADEIIDAMADALLVLDQDGLVRVANRAACHLFDRSEDKLLGADIRELTPLMAKPGVELDRLILRGSLRDFESQPATPRRGIAALSISSFVMRGQGTRPVAFVCIIKDITGRKQAEDEIQRHVERQAALHDIDVATTSTLELDAVLELLMDRLNRLLPQLAVTIMLVSAESQRLRKVASRGIDDDAWKAEPENDDSGTEHPVLQNKSAVLESNIQLRGTGPQSEYFRKSGFVSYLGVPLIAKDKVLGILSFYSRQERSYSEDEVSFLETLAGQAAAAIHNSQLYEQTRKQAMELEKASQVKDEFLSVMSHELRTPLNVIAGYAKIVQDGVLGEVNLEQTRALERVSRHSNELLVMVNSIMDATKIEAGAIIVEGGDFPLSEFLDELKVLYDYPLGKDVALRWNYPPDLPVIRTDRDKLKHILQNLINNALKFTETGHVDVSVRYLAGAEVVEFSVADTGIGIAASDLPLIFERFRQLDGSKTRAHSGVGLGLHIVKTFVQLLGGEVNATSEFGKGSTFTITLSRDHAGRGSTYRRDRAEPNG